MCGRGFVVWLSAGLLAWFLQRRDQILQNDAGDIWGIRTDDRRRGYLKFSFALFVGRREACDQCAIFSPKLHCPTKFENTCTEPHHLHPWLWLQYQTNNICHSKQRINFSMCALLFIPVYNCLMVEVGHISKSLIPITVVHHPATTGISFLPSSLTYHKKMEDLLFKN